MAKKKHMTKNDILRAYKEMRDIKHSADKAPFTGMATLCNYVLWKDEGWYQKKLAEYNQCVAECDRLLDEGKLLLSDISKRLFDKAGFTVDYEPYTYEDIRIPKKMGALYKMEMEIIDSQNTINEMSVRYFLIHYNVLMDMGYGKMRLGRNKDYINSRLAVINKDDGHRVMDLHRELLDGVGVYIEMPDLRG